MKLKLNIVQGIASKRQKEKTIASHSKSREISVQLGIYSLRGTLENPPSFARMGL